MNGYGTEDSSSTNVARGQETIVAQLQKAIPAMHHIDKLFLWLAQAMVHTFEVQAVEWWALQATEAGQYSIQLRAMMARDSSIPQYVLASERVAAMVERLPDTPQSFMQMSVERLCVPYQATLFGRYGMRYCAWQSLRDSTLLLPTQQTVPGRPTPLTVTMLLYGRHPISQQVLTAVQFILEQAIPMARAYGLLLSAASASYKSLPLPGAQQTFTGQLAPHPFMQPPTQQPVPLLPEPVMPAWPTSAGPQTTPLPPTFTPYPQPAPMIPPQSAQTAPISLPQIAQASTATPQAQPATGQEKVEAQGEAAPIPTDPQALLNVKHAKSPQLKAQQTYLDLLQLTPRQYDKPMGIELAGMRASKPVIADKQARRLYEAIDGKGTLEVIRATINMDLQDLYRAVRFLLIQQRIQLFEPSGQLVDKEQFLKEH